jgi:hypothetical protein
MYVRKEAVLSSMIEGTQSSLSDLLLFELDMEPGVPLNDVREVSNYDWGSTFDSCWILLKVKCRFDPRISCQIKRV